MNLRALFRCLSGDWDFRLSLRRCLSLRKQAHRGENIFNLQVMRRTSLLCQSCGARGSKMDIQSNRLKLTVTSSSLWSLVDCLPAAFPAPVSRGRPPSVILRLEPSPLRSGPSVWTPAPLLPVGGKLHLVPVVGVALLLVVVMAIAPLRGPPAVTRFVVLVLRPLPETVVRFEGIWVWIVPWVKGGRRRERRVWVVHGVGKRGVVHRLRGHRVRHRWVG